MWLRRGLSFSAPNKHGKILGPVADSVIGTKAVSPPFLCPSNLAGRDRWTEKPQETPDGLLERSLPHCRFFIRIASTSRSFSVAPSCKVRLPGALPAGIWPGRQVERVSGVDRFVVIRERDRSAARPRMLVAFLRRQLVTLGHSVHQMA
jgi:hypothetical protein